MLVFFQLFLVMRGQQRGKKVIFSKLVPSCSYCPIPHQKAKCESNRMQLVPDRANPCDFLMGHVIMIYDYNMQMTFLSQLKTGLKRKKC